MHWVSDRGGAGAQSGGSHVASDTGSGHSKPSGHSAAGPQCDTVRIATFNFSPLDRRKLNNRHVAGQLAELIRQFDLVAVQNIQAPNQGLLVALVEQINTGGRGYDFAVAREVGQTPLEQFSAFLFDRATIEIDRSTVYRVADTSGQLRRPPLVGSFRVHGPDPAEAFTFTLINVHNDAGSAAAEFDLLDDVLHAVCDDGRGEDDVILLGDFGSDDGDLGELGQVPQLVCAVSGLPSNVRTSQLNDNLLFDQRKTREFTGRSGVMDLMRHFNLPLENVLEISDHFPVWAEFSAYEGGQAGQIAASPR